MTGFDDFLPSCSWHGWPSSLCARWASWRTSLTRLASFCWWFWRWWRARSRRRQRWWNRKVCTRVGSLCKECVHKVWPVKKRSIKDWRRMGQGFWSSYHIVVDLVGQVLANVWADQWTLDLWQGYASKQQEGEHLDHDGFHRLAEVGRSSFPSKQQNGFKTPSLSVTQLG